jgi:hypothetical protein
VSAATDRFNLIAPRALPLLAGLVVLGLGYYWFVGPNVVGFTKAQAEARALDLRVKMLRQAVGQGQSGKSPDGNEAFKRFEERVSKDDRVAEVSELLVKAVTESATDGKLRNLAMGTGGELTRGATEPVRAATDARTIDARWALFPYNLTFTPVTISFDSSYSTIAGFFAKIHDLPTTIEIQSVKLTRGLPLMHAQITVLVFRRGDRVATAEVLEPERAAPTPAASQSPSLPNPLIPRIIEAAKPLR